ncbi:alternate-type signal peptide domain-containing protein [Cellulomonas shaoxiangyii]|uniref:Alternate-type signal peptide domain-containing protein n=1 Tax=Cellulomonas shaoxiangyii TaxID=2566013 RepID=A0A4P7SJN6_9CELL|nr:alternate-type signal peptide domain-containing protein [Cellulomonas shaoxiangyii]QCB92924.1 alternate-type signal peptide domain-containing protein [Cellulomonas shaoxiangyii]TGY85388.1 alternate-type signal peptide domain-containing protein [Cellulomonas shaoxiangyii]
MQNKTKGILAGVAGVALLTSGATFALWTDSGTAAGGTITNGRLDVNAAAVATWADVSADRTDRGHAITDLATWRMVPGDTIEGTQALDVALEGDNLVASLVVDSTAATLPTGVTVTYQVLAGATGTTVLAETRELGTDSTVRLAAPRAGQAAGAPTNTGTTLVGATLDGVADLRVVYRVAFDATTAGQVSATAQSVIQGLTATLTQTRQGADFVAAP